MPASMFLNIILVVVLDSCGKSSALKFVPRIAQFSSFQIALPQGIIQGRIDHTLNQKLRYYSFVGIPYALPPIGDLRFRAPVPAGTWTEVLDTFRKNAPACIQITPSLMSGYEESEDCLYVNVFTPLETLTNISSAPPLPVMVWIYGGAFLTGAPDSSSLGPDYLLESNVIVVQFAYRLGAFGFLSTADLESPGNYGLKDQHLALRWIHDNIQYFGGDVNRITIFGESAGAASVEYQLLYQRNEGLFQGAISESGSALNAWSFQRYPLKVAFDLGVRAGIRTKSSKLLVKYLREMPVDALKNAAFQTSVENSAGIVHGIPFAPTIEPAHPDAFLANKTHQLLEEGNFLKVPYIQGFNSGELGLVKNALKFANVLLEIYNLDPRILVPYGVTEEAGDEIKKSYFGSSESRLDQYVKYINDAYFSRAIIESARLISQFSPTYLYTFSYEGFLGRNSLGFRRLDDYEGVSHTEEMAYLWARNYLPEASPMDRIVRSRIVRMWTNFAKTGNPTPKEEDLLQNVIWPKVSFNMSYLDIDEMLTVGEKLEENSTEFWNDIYRRYGSPPYDTY